MLACTETIQLICSWFALQINSLVPAWVKEFLGLNRLIFKNEWMYNLSWIYLIRVLFDFLYSIVFLVQF